MYLLLTPLLLLVVGSSIILPKSLGYSIFHFCGYITGYLLVGGAIAVLPNLYWNICFYFDIFILVLVSVSDTYRNEELLEQSARDAERQERDRLAGDEEANMSSFMSETVEERSSLLDQGNSSQTALTDGISYIL